jgi:hypothetical protein
MFDTLCRYVERYEPQEIREKLRETKLFVFEESAEDTIKVSKLPTQDDETFFLPFRCIAIEDPHRCVLLRDRTEHQRGFWLERDFLFLGCITDEDNQIADNAYLMSSGSIKMDFDPELPHLEPPRETGAHFVLNSINTALIRPSGDPDPQIITEQMYKDGKQSQFKNLLKVVGFNLNLAFEAIIQHINNPENFVVEVTPLHYERNKEKLENKPRILRMHERPLYTYLKAKRARTIMGLTDPHHSPRGERNSPVPHERRRHLRTLRSDFFTHKQGQTIVVEATWVGPSESIVGNKRYKVLLDK